MSAILIQALVVVLGVMQGADTRSIPPPYPLTETEATQARELAQHEMMNRFLPSARREPEFYRLEGIELEGLRLGDPYLYIALGEGSIDDYCESSVDDPRLYASLVHYIFPIHVSGRRGPVIWMWIVRNLNGDREKYNGEEGALFFGGYSYADSTGTAEVSKAQNLRERFHARISFVTFLDRHTDRIVVDDPSGPRSGTSADTMKGIAEDAPILKHDLCPIH